MIVAMAGLPGTGKSTIARILEKEHGFFILDKDQVRQSLFGARFTDYTTEQNDLCIDLMIEVAAYLHARHPAITIIFDGRPFSQERQVRTLVEAALRINAELHWVKLFCSDESAKERIERARGIHPAENRTFQWYLDSKAKEEPLKVDHLLIDTDKGSPDDAAAEIAAYLRLRLQDMQ
ncbi:MAG TPA: AAA family ATPase [Sphaerochaeta sp.]|jgi:predicted kinase|nr:AAA family ATPase [Sphaerochaeta sp.]